MEARTNHRTPPCPAPLGRPSNGLSARCEARIDRGPGTDRQPGTDHEPGVGVRPKVRRDAGAGADTGADTGAGAGADAGANVAAECEPGALLRRCLDGPSEADWRQLVELYGRWIRGLVVRAFRERRIEPPDDLVDDLVQDLFLRLLRRQGAPFQGRDAGGVHAYLERAVHNLLVDRWRRMHAIKRGYEEVSSGLLDGREVDARSGERHVRRVAHHLVDRSPSPEQVTARRQGRKLFVRTCLEAHRNAQGRKSPAQAAGWVGAEVEVRALFRVFVDGSTSVDVSRDLGGALRPRQVDALVARYRRHMASSGVRLPSRHAGRRP